MDLTGVWRAMEECHRLGLPRMIFFLKAVGAQPFIKGGKQDYTINDTSSKPGTNRKEKSKA
jgi:hypothetical protein